MFNYFTELMLTQYFTIDAIFGRYIADKRKLFSRLGEIYLVDGEEAEGLYELSESVEVKEICSDADYFRYRRTKHYDALNDRKFPVEGEIDELILIKGGAITAAKRSGIFRDSECSKFSACNLLTWAADSGVIAAMNVLGILQQEGIIFVQDKSEGLKNIVKSAKWNSDQGLMAAIYYDESGRGEYLPRIIANLEKGSLTQALEAIITAFGKPHGKADKTYYLLEKAFDQKILKPEVYCKQYARIMFSDIISHRDKESLFFSSGKEVSAYASDLPLKLSPATVVEYDGEIGRIMRPYHGEEIAKLKAILENSDLRKLATYRPLCVVSDSAFILENFAESLKMSIRANNVERIEVGDLAQYDLEPTKNNVLVRNCDEDMTNVYFLFFRGDINERAFEMCKNFLQTDKRAKFRLLQPGLCIDLTAIMPVCFCDKENAKLLRPYCDVLTIGNFTADEKVEITDKILALKGQLYGVEGISAEQSVYEKLKGCSPEEIERILDSVVCERRKGGSLLLTADMLAPYLKSRAQTHNTYGFGGGAHE